MLFKYINYFSKEMLAKRKVKRAQQLFWNQSELADIRVRPSGKCLKTGEQLFTVEKLHPPLYTGDKFHIVSMTDVSWDQIKSQLTLKK